MARLLTVVHSTGFPGVEDPSNPWWTYSVGRQVLR